MELASRTVGNGDHRRLSWLSSVQQLVLDLMSRPLPPGNGVVVKLNDSCNDLMSDFVGPPALFLYGALPDFIASVLKQDDRRAWVRERTRTFWQTIAKRRALPPSAQPPVDDARAAALLWLTYVEEFETFLQADPGAAVRSLPAATFMTDAGLKVSSLWWSA